MKKAYYAVLAVLWLFLGVGFIDLCFGAFHSFPWPICCAITGAILCFIILLMKEEDFE